MTQQATVSCTLLSTQGRSGGSAMKYKGRQDKEEVGDVEYSEITIPGYCVLTGTNYVV